MKWLPEHCGKWAMTQKPCGNWERKQKPYGNWKMTQKPYGNWERAHKPYGNDLNNIDKDVQTSVQTIVGSGKWH